MVQIVRFDPRKHSHLIPRLITCYREVFANRPWNEWKKCPKCGVQWGITCEKLLSNGRCPNCRAELVDFWPRERVRSKIARATTPGASAFVALDGGAGVKVVGFCWGYPMAPGDLESKLGIRFRDALFGRFGAVDRVAFQDELGVSVPFRNRKIARRMFIARLLDFLAKGLEVGVMRTRHFPEPTVTFLWFTQKLGYEIIARYPGNDGRVILAGRLRGLYGVM